MRRWAARVRKRRETPPGTSPRHPPSAQHDDERAGEVLRDVGPHLRGQRAAYDVKTILENMPNVGEVDVSIRDMRGRRSTVRRTFVDVPGAQSKKTAPGVNVNTRRRA